MKKSRMQNLGRLILVVSSLVVTAPIQAASLLGNGTLNVADDLTLIDDNGTVLEFLDLTFTVNQTIDEAVTAYAGDGFGFATDDDITALLDAFGTVYQFSPFTYVDLGATAGSRSSFVSYLGVTSGNASLGWFDATGAGGNPYTYLCMAISGCGPLSFVNNQFDPPNSLVGVFLVRTVPVPAAVWLFGSGLLGLVGVARRKKTG
jgi:hypothetical protein